MYIKITTSDCSSDVTCMESQTTSTPEPFSTCQTLHCTSLLTHWLSPLLHTFMSLLISLPSERPGTHLTHHPLPAANVLETSTSLHFSNPALHIVFYPALDFTASSYHSSSATSISLRSFLITSLHLFLGPHLGCG